MFWLQFCHFLTWPGSLHDQGRQLSKAADRWGQQRSLGPAACFCYIRAAEKARRPDVDRKMLLGLVKGPSSTTQCFTFLSLIILLDAVGPTLWGLPHQVSFLLSFKVLGSPSLLLLASFQQQQTISSEYNSNVPPLQEVLNGCSTIMFTNLPTLHTQIWHCLIWHCFDRFSLISMVVSPC